MIATLPGTHADPVQKPFAAASNASRWLHVVSHTDPRYGGMSSAVPSLASSLASHHGLGTPLAAFCLAGETYTPQGMRDADITFWPTSRKAWSLHGKVRSRFADLVRECDGLHIHGLWEASTAEACRVARRLGKPYVLSAHGMLEPWALATKRLKKRVYAALIERNNVAGAACLHALTVAEAEQYRRFGATCPIAVIPNAVDLPQGADAELFLQRFPDLRGKRLVLFLSRLHPKKGLDLLIEAWSQVTGAHPEAHLVLAGPDAEGMQAALTAQAAGKGMAARITFTGMLTGAMKWNALAAAEGYVLPSYSEGLSMALLEAMGMGLPVIATRACNMPQLTAAGAGWEIEANVSSLTSALSDLLNRSPEENGRTGHNGLDLIAVGYSSAQVSRQMAEVYKFVLSGYQPGGVELDRRDAR